jgi:hypothetical protein
MNKAIQHSHVEVSAPPLHLPNAASTAENVLEKALEYCSRKTGIKGTAEAIRRIRQNDHCFNEYCNYSIAEQVGAALASLDKNIKAVYMFEYEATPEDVCFGQAPHSPLLHLLVWAQPKTKALNALVSTLDHALAHRYAELIGPSQLQHLLDVQIIDDADVENRKGYGALLSSLYRRPLKVWEQHV